MPVRPRRLLAALLLALGATAAATGCAEDPPAAPVAEKPPWLWSGLGFRNDLILGVSLQEGALFAAGGAGGLFRQDPAFFGPWRFLGLAYPELAGRYPLYGVNDVVVLGGTVFASVRSAPGDSIPDVFRGAPGTGGWDPVDLGIGEGSVAGLIASGDGALIAVTAAGEILRADNPDVGWTLVHEGAAAGLLALHRGPGGLFVAGVADVYVPRLLHSADGGRTWEEIALPDSLVPPGGAHIGGIVSAAGEDAAWILTVGSGVFRTGDGGATFERILTTAGPIPELLVDPADPQRLLVFGDVVHATRDGGSSWSVFPGPHGGRLFAGAADWDRGYVAVWEHEDELLSQTLHCLNLAVLPPPVPAGSLDAAP